MSVRDTSDSDALADRIIGHYEKHAQVWDGDRGRNLFEKSWLDRFLTLTGDADASVLDIGCGSGEPIAQYLISQGRKVTGIDAAPTLIDLCRARFPTHDWFVGDMRKLALGRQFNGLIAWDSFFHLTPADQRPMFPLFRQHAAPGAALMFTSGPSHGEAIGSYRGDPLYHGSLAPEEYTRLLAHNGFTVVAHTAEDPECGGHTIWLAQRRD